MSSSPPLPSILSSSFPSSSLPSLPSSSSSSSSFFPSHPSSLLPSSFSLPSPLPSFLTPSKPRGQLACCDCRSRKRKCDGKLPCNNCSIRDFNCTYPPVLKRGPRLGKRVPKVVPMETNVGLLETKECCRHHEDEEEPASKVQRLIPLPPPSPAATSSLFNLPANLPAQYGRYIWSFFVGPATCLPLVKQDLFIEAATQVFSSSAESEAPEQRSPSFSFCALKEGGCCQLPPTGYMPNCPCFKFAQGGLVWGVLSLGAQMCGEPVEAANFVVAARESLMKSMYCAGEMTAQVFFILSQYYYGMGDSRLAFKVIKKGLDIVNTLSSPTPGIRALCDFLCLLFYLPSSPNSTTPLSIQPQELESFSHLRLEPMQFGISSLPTAENAQYACLKLLAEAAGHLANAERLHPNPPGSAKQVLALVTRNIELCRQVHEAWQPFGAMNTLMASVYDSVFLWSLRYREKTALEGRPMDEGIGEGVHPMDENVAYFLSFLHRLPLPAGPQAERSSETLATPSQQVALPETGTKAHSPKLTTGSLVTNLSSHPLRKLLPVFLFSLLFNGSSLMSDWKLSDELARMNGYLKEMSQVWPMLSAPNEKLELALLHHKNGSAQQQPPPQHQHQQKGPHHPLHVETENPSIAQAGDFATIFWNSSSNEVLVSEFLRDIGLPSLEQGSTELELESFFL